MKIHRVLTGLSISLMCVAIFFGMFRGTLTYKSNNREVLLVVESQDAETVSAILGLVTMLLGCSQRKD